MEWLKPVDDYCERVGPDFWAEPLNALSNASFLAAALYGFILARRGRDSGVAMLAVVAAMVAIGSFLFHTLATRWAALADVIPIVLFILLAFGLSLSRGFGLSALAAFAATAAFLVASPLISMLAAPLMGRSAGYAPALLALLFVGSGLRYGGRPGGGLLIAAGVVFAVSIGLRMADLPACEAIPAGTHFGWHLLNGLVLALVMRALSVAPDRGAALSLARFG